jgi:hypothetical protein
LGGEVTTRSVVTSKDLTPWPPLLGGEGEEFFDIVVVDLIAGYEDELFRVDKIAKGIYSLWKKVTKIWH